MRITFLTRTEKRCSTFVSPLGFHSQRGSSNRFGRLSCERGCKQRRGAITTLITRITLFSLTPRAAVTPRQPDRPHSRWLKKNNRRVLSTGNPPHGTQCLFFTATFNEPHSFCCVNPPLLANISPSTTTLTSTNTDKNGFWPSGTHLGNVAYFTTIVLSLLTSEAHFQNKQRRVAVKKKTNNC